MLTAQRTGNTMGAEVCGADLSAPMDDATFRQVQHIFLEHRVIVFRRQELTAPRFLDFANRFGRPEPHLLDQFHHPDYSDILILSNVKKDGKPIGLADGGTYWHSDYSYLEIPARATLLYSIQVPKIGGNTLFADQVTAYDDLPESMKTRIDRLVANPPVRQSRRLGFAIPHRCLSSGRAAEAGAGNWRNPSSARAPPSAHGPQSLVRGVWNIPRHRRHARG